MCQLCALIDYPIADCWRPCYHPQAKQKAKGLIPTTPRGGFSDEDFSQQQKVNDLLGIIRRQREAIARLKATQNPDSPPRFEGVE